MILFRGVDIRSSLWSEICVLQTLQLNERSLDNVRASEACEPWLRAMQGMRGMRAVAASHASQDGESTCESHSY